MTLCNIHDEFSKRMDAPALAAMLQRTRRLMGHDAACGRSNLMAVVGSATPLIALDAVVIDTETTSLDPAKARIVEIAAVRLVGGRLDPPEPLPAPRPAGRTDPDSGHRDPSHR